jgi:hypothetical protein
MKKSVIILGFALLMSLSASAQKSNWSFFAGYNNAVGSFARVDVPNNDWALISNTSIKGGAGYGFDLGFSYRQPLGGNDKYCLVFSADFLWTNSAYSIRHNLNMTMAEVRSNFDKVNAKSPNFINVPVLAGFHYEFGIGKNAEMFVAPQIGASFRHITDRSAEFIGATDPIMEGNNALYEYVYVDNYYNSLAFAFRLTAGFVFKEHWIVDLSYLYTGRLMVEGYEDFRFSTNSDLSNPISGSTSFTAGHTTPMFVTIRFGYRL